MVTEIFMSHERAVKRPVWEWEMLYIQWVSRAELCVITLIRAAAKASEPERTSASPPGWGPCQTAHVCVCVCVRPAPPLGPSICPPSLNAPSSMDWNAWPRGFWERIGPRRARYISPQAINVQSEQKFREVWECGTLLKWISVVWLSTLCSHLFSLV